jgi:cytochrome c biogenesis protein CcdA
MLKFIEEIFGKDWRTTLWGTIMLAALAINQTPTVIDFLPDNAEAWVRGISGIIVIASGLKFVNEAKDKANSEPNSK